MCYGRSARDLAAVTLYFVLLPGVATGQESSAVSDQEGRDRVLWKYAPNGARFTQVLVRSGTVFALDCAGFIHALEASSGAVRWVSEGKETFGWGYGMALSAAPGLDALFCGSDTGLFALQCKTGKKLWHAELALGTAGPACTGQAVVAGSADGNVYAWDPKTGVLLWKHDYMEDKPDDPPGFRGANARFGNRSARPRNVETDGKMVVLSIFDQCRALALDAATGKRLWDFQTQGWMYGTPAIGPHNVFVGSQDRHVYAVDKEMGKLSWKVATRSRVEASPACADRFLYIGSCDANLYAVDQTVGRIAWQFATDTREGRGGPIYSRAIVLGDTVYLAAMAGKVYAVDRDTGVLRWKLRPLASSELNSDLVEEENRLFVTTRMDGKLGQSAVLAIKADGPPR